MQKYENPVGSTPLPQTGITHEQELKALACVLRHPEISRSASLVRFLTFICDMYFADRSAEIREHAIAVRALGRKERTFDSQADPIVRVTARALRKRLRDFYDNEGKDQTVELVIPVGHYVPQFVLRASSSAANTSVPEAGEPPQAVSSFRVPLIDPASVTVSVSLSSTSASAESVFGRLIRRLFGRWPSYWIALLAVCLPLVFTAGLLLGRRPPQPVEVGSSGLRWGSPVWSDEFTGPAMQVPDPTRWTYDVGDQNQWGNHELESYCSTMPSSATGCDPQHPNAFLDGAGHLILRAERNADGNWTSARLTTRGLKNFQYGRIEARMKLPVGTGLWPAFWLLGADFPKVGWPQAGSVDIVENVSTSARANSLGPNRIRASLHTPGFAGGNSLRRDYELPNGGRIDDAAFHTYGVIWSPGMMQFYVDDPSNIYFVRTISDIPKGAAWVFDKPFYMVLDLAVGGDWAGDPNNTTVSPADIVVDYVRVYQIPSVAMSLDLSPIQLADGKMTTASITLHGQKNMGRVYLACQTEPQTAQCSLEASSVDLTTSPQADDKVTVSAMNQQDGRQQPAAPGTYRLTITATNMSGDQTSTSELFQVHTSPPPDPSS